MIRPKLINALLKQPGPPFGPMADDTDTIADANQSEAMRDLTPKLVRGGYTSPSQMARLLSPEVGYMELEGGWGAGGCRNCLFINEDGFCTHTAILAPVSDKGCSNMFWPKDLDPNFPPGEPPPAGG